MKTCGIYMNHSDMPAESYAADNGSAVAPSLLNVELGLIYRLREWAEWSDDQAENGLANLLCSAANNIDRLRVVAQAADELMATLGAKGEIDTLHPKTQILLDALYEWRPKFE